MPATVNARVPLDVIGEPATEIKPPVKDCATLVTVPLVAGAAQVGAPPVVAVRTCPVVPAAVATGVAPAPPPYTTPYWVRAALEAHVLALLK